MQELPIMTLQLDRAGSGDYAEKANLDVFLVALADVEIKIQSIDPQAELAEHSLRRDDAWRHKRVATAAYYCTDRMTDSRRDRCRKKIVSGFAASWRHRATIELPALNDESE
jgi:hypothetical protein